MILQFALGSFLLAAVTCFTFSIVDQLKAKSRRAAYLQWATRSVCLFSTGFNVTISVASFLLFAFQEVLEEVARRVM